MYNKKQIHLKTITLDWPALVDSSPKMLTTHQRAKGSLNISATTSPSKSLSSSININNELEKRKNSKMSKRQQSCMNKFRNLEINRYKVDRFIGDKKKEVVQSLYQRFPIRSNNYKNNNAFKFYLNSEVSQRNYTQSIDLFKKINLKINDVHVERPIIVTRPQTCKTRPVQQALIEGVKFSAKKRAHSSSYIRGSKTKRQKCTTVPQFSPWQTSEEKVLTEW